MYGLGLAVRSGDMFRWTSDVTICASLGPTERPMDRHTRHSVASVPGTCPYDSRGLWSERRSQNVRCHALTHLAPTVDGPWVQQATCQTESETRHTQTQHTRGHKRPFPFRLRPCLKKPYLIADGNTLSHSDT